MSTAQNIAATIIANLADGTFDMIQLPGYDEPSLSDDNVAAAFVDLLIEQGDIEAGDAEPQDIAAALVSLSAETHTVTIVLSADNLIHLDWEGDNNAQRRVLRELSELLEETMEIPEGVEIEWDLHPNIGHVGASITGEDGDAVGQVEDAYRAAWDKLIETGEAYEATMARLADA